MKTLGALKIKQPYIALFGSGSSVHELSAAEFNLIKSRCFVITVNYAPVHLKGHLNMWSDRRVSEFMGRFFTQNPKDILCLAQDKRVPEPLKEKVDYWFNRSEEKLKGNYTIVWALQLLQKYFPEKAILLFGVDMYPGNGYEAKWYDRYTDFDKLKRGHRYNLQSRLDQCAQQIERYCSGEKIINCNPKSGLSCFPKKEWQSILPMRILHVCPSALAGAPSHLSRIINKYTPLQSRSVLRREFRSPEVNNLRWEYDVIAPSPQQARELFQWADIIHYHRKAYLKAPEDKPSLLQYHSPPNGYRPGQTDAAFNNRKLVIAQYHPRFYTDARIVPNLIDIWDSIFLPAPKSTQHIKIFFSWATEVKGGWSDKGSKRTQAILQSIKKKYGSGVEVCIMHNQPHSVCMAEKQTAHICIDECVTGSYHLQSLEGCSVGALTFNNIDEKTEACIEAVTGQKSHPFEKVGLDNLYNRLCHYIDHPQAILQKGRQARAWMEKHWNPQELVNHYLKAYTDISLQSQPGGPVGKPPPKTEPAPKKKAVRIIPQAYRSLQPSPGVDARPELKSKRERAPQPHGRSIESLHQRFEGQDIYIFGTGPSLFKVNADDFKDKICFGINFAFEAMPHIDFHFAHVIEVYQALRKVADNQKLILPETLVPQWYRERPKQKYFQRMPPENAEAFEYPIQNPAEKNISRKNISLQPDARIFTWSTTTHSAIHLAAYMGAKRIFLIGVDYKLYPNNKVHFDSKYYPAYGQQNWNANQKHRQGDRWLAEALGAKGIELSNLSTSLLQAPANRKIKAML